MNFLTRIFGSRNERVLRACRATVQQINALEPALEALSDADLQGKTALFRQQLEQGKCLDDLLPEAFAVVREASRRVMKLRHFDVQLMGGMILHQGKIAEMGTGEGKTLTSTLPVYLNALSGKGVHIVTVNDYLAQRDAQWMGAIYNFLGLSVGVTLSGQERQEKQKAYNSDITYGTNNEYGFDYLRDNMVYEAQDRVQRSLHYAIVDEVDSILIDEARTPLIISGLAEDHTELYRTMNTVAPLLQAQEGEADPRTGLGVVKPGDFTLDEKARQVNLTERGHENAERILAERGLITPGASLYDPVHINLVHHLYAALRAHNLFQRDQHYVVHNGQVVIVDEFTGRLMEGRRWSDGLHQAVEAKEGVDIQAENQTLASITFQNYFRLYKKLAGMTGTADTEAYEFQQIYGLETVVLPPNRPSQRKDQQDRIYKTMPEKMQAALSDIKDCHERGQPVLVGTSSIENSEAISQLLQKAKLPHQVLNAKQHAKEAEIIAQAGRLRMITIATNMAGRGTDIVLGGNWEKMVQKSLLDKPPKDDTESQARNTAFYTDWEKEHEQVKQLGGLRIIATERHESRRIDNQLRGRSGRQGDSGSSRFYLSLEDPLLRIFAGDKVRAIMDRLKMPEGEAIEAGMVSRSIESAQRKVEARNFDIRKQLLEFDDIANEQRQVIYQQRNDILNSTDVSEQITAFRQGCFGDVVENFVPPESIEEQWDVAGLERALKDEWQLDVPLQALLQEGLDSVTALEIKEAVQESADAVYTEKLETVGKAAFGNFERMVLLQNLDMHWREHMSALDHLRQGIHLRGYAQKQPKQEYKREAFELFGVMLDAVRTQVTRILMTVQVQDPNQAEEAAEKIEARAERLENVRYSAASEVADSSVATPAKATRVGRNQPCPCGSGKKYKHCHGRLA